MTGESASAVAGWMVAQIDEGQSLYQEVVVHEIAERFGVEFTYINANGNRAISKEVLTKFKELTGDSVVWERGERCWRKRASYDGPGRQQD
jgi:hypothetical protein